MHMHVIARDRTPTNHTQNTMSRALKLPLKMYTFVIVYDKTKQIIDATAREQKLLTFRAIDKKGVINYIRDISQRFDHKEIPAIY